MRAVVYERYGPPEVLQLTEVPRPASRDAEVLKRVRATTVTSGDWRTRSPEVPAGFGLMARLFLGLTGPRQPILGTELAGDVVAVGSGVSRFEVGDQVFAYPGAGMGCYVEYRCMREDGPVELKPANLSYEEAAGLCFGGQNALDCFRGGKLQRGETVLINGASGGVGTAALQLLMVVLSEGTTQEEATWGLTAPRGAERLQLARLQMSRGEFQRAIDVASAFESATPRDLRSLPAGKPENQGGCRWRW